MRFAGGAVGVGSPTVRSLLVMALLPSFILSPCNFEREEIERNRYPLVFYTTLMIFFPGRGNHEQNAVENRVSCRHLLYIETL